MFGEKNVKWITRIDLVTEETKGFYEQQGWGPNFVVPTQSRFTEPAFDQALKVGAPVALRGTAHAGDRGVGGVEVSVDDGATWQPAQLEYSGSPLAWAFVSLLAEHARQVEHRHYPADEGTLDVLAAAVDHIVATSRQACISTEVPDAVRALIERGLGKNHGQDGPASLVSVIAAPSEVIR